MNLRLKLPELDRYRDIAIFTDGTTPVSEEEIRLAVEEEMRRAIEDATK